MIGGQSTCKEQQNAKPNQDHDAFSQNRPQQIDYEKNGSVRTPCMF